MFSKVLIHNYELISVCLSQQIPTETPGCNVTTCDISGCKYIELCKDLFPQQATLTSPVWSVSLFKVNPRFREPITFLHTLKFD